MEHGTLEIVIMQFTLSLGIHFQSPGWDPASQYNFNGWMTGTQ